RIGETVVAAVVHRRRVVDDVAVEGDRTAVQAVPALIAHRRDAEGSAVEIGIVGEQHGGGDGGTGVLVERDLVLQAAPFLDVAGISPVGRNVVPQAGRRRDLHAGAGGAKAAIGLAEA